jgi:hypothetical protein
MTWTIVVWCVLILVWAIAGAVSTANEAAKECAHETLLSTQTCESAYHAGGGIGVALILFIGFVGFVFLSLIWFMTKPERRMCPVCGQEVLAGMTACDHCGHDFAAAAAQWT